MKQIIVGALMFSLLWGVPGTAGGAVQEEILYKELGQLQLRTQVLARNVATARQAPQGATKISLIEEQQRIRAGALRIRGILYPPAAVTQTQLQEVSPYAALMLQPQQGAPGEVVRVYWRGIMADTPSTITLGSAIQSFNIPATLQDAAIATITVPREAAPGAYTVWASNARVGNSATKTLTVTGPVSPTTIRALRDLAQKVQGQRDRMKMHFQKLEGETRLQKFQ
jgi:hypothetical protein